MLPTPDIEFYVPCMAIPRIKGGLVEVPGYVASPDFPWMISDQDSPFAALSDLYQLKPVAHCPRGVTVLSVRDRISRFQHVDPIQG